jgi:co-chaperonin GroES (HSP10)
MGSANSRQYTGYRGKRGIILIAFILFCIPHLAHSQEQKGTVVFVLGKAFVKRGEVETQLKQGDKIFEKDIIRTEGTSKIKIYFDDESVLTLGENTTLSLEEYTLSLLDDKRSVLLNLIRGRLRAIVGKIIGGAGSRYEVKTPTSITGVRGTHFYVFAMENLTRVALFSGGLSLRNILENIAGEVILKPGQMSIVPEGMPPADPITLSEDDQTGMILETEIYEEEGMPEEEGIPGIEQKEGGMDIPDIIKESMIPESTQDFLPPLVQEPLVQEPLIESLATVNVIIKLPGQPGTTPY